MGRVTAAQKKRVASWGDGDLDGLVPVTKKGRAIDIVIGGTPGKFTKEQALHVAHMIGRYMLDMGDFVYTYVDEEVAGGERAKAMRRFAEEAETRLETEFRRGHSGPKDLTRWYTLLSHLAREASDAWSVAGDASEEIDDGYAQKARSTAYRLRELADSYVREAADRERRGMTSEEFIAEARSRRDRRDRRTD